MVIVQMRSVHNRYETCVVDENLPLLVMIAIVLINRVE